AARGFSTRARRALCFHLEQGDRHACPFPSRRPSDAPLMPPSTSREELRRRVYAAIDRRAEEIIGIGERIASHAEMGFKESKTAQLVSETLQGLGLAPRTGLARTGVRAEAGGRAGEGPTFALIGELDGLRVTGHPQADRETGAAHACGHNAQVAGMLGAAMGLMDAQAFDH